MPICTVVDGPNNLVPLAHLKIFCQEIIPAALRDDEHKLNPGDVQIIPFGIEDESSLTVDTLFKIEAEPSEKRYNKRLKTIDAITNAFQEIFPKTSTVITLYLTLDGYRSTHPVEMPKVKDMSMKAAVERVKTRIAALGSSS